MTNLHRITPEITKSKRLSLYKVTQSNEEKGEESVAIVLPLFIANYCYL